MPFSFYRVFSSQRSTNPCKGLELTTKLCFLQLFLYFFTSLIHRFSNFRALFDGSIGPYKAQCLIGSLMGAWVTDRMYWPFQAKLHNFWPIFMKIMLINKNWVCKLAINSRLHWKPSSWFFTMRLTVFWLIRLTFNIMGLTLFLNRLWELCQRNLKQKTAGYWKSNR